MIEVARQAYPDRGTLMRDLAELVADQLRGACASKGHATLAVPGGTTPGPFLEALSEAELAWKDVRVMPTDERMVSERSPRSNARLIREALLKGKGLAVTGDRILMLAGQSQTAGATNMLRVHVIS